MDWTNLPPVKDEAGKKFNQILTVTDRGYKQVILIPCCWKDKTTIGDIQFLREGVRHRGLPSSIVSDRDTKFTSVFWRSLCNLMEVKARLTSTFHAQANGAAERINQTMKQVLRTVVLSKQQQPNCGTYPNWLRLLDMVEIVINNAPIANTELSLFYLTFGYHPRFWFDVRNFDEIRLEGDKTIQVRDWINKIRANWDMVYRALYHEQARAETFGNRKRAEYHSKWDKTF